MQHTPFNKTLANAIARAVADDNQCKALAVECWHAFGKATGKTTFGALSGESVEALSDEYAKRFCDLCEPIAQHIEPRARIVECTIGNLIDTCAVYNEYIVLAFMVGYIDSSAASERVAIFAIDYDE